ncbi:MAG: helix-turn-helix domain-containing protein [Gemmatimonadota bacterium]
MVALRIRLGRTIREYRKRAGVSQERFAHQIGLHRTFMSAVERGKTNVSFDALGRIADGLNLTISQLVFEAETGQPLELVGRERRTTPMPATPGPRRPTAADQAPKTPRSGAKPLKQVAEKPRKPKR